MRMHQQRRNSPVLTYNGFSTIISGSPHSTQFSPHNTGDRRFWYRSLFFGTFFLAACLYVSLDPNSYHNNHHNGSIRRSGRKLDQLLSNLRTKNERTKIQLRYKVPDPQEYTRSLWTLEDFPVNGVNLAQFGFETEIQKKQRGSATLNEPFELYEEFDISPFLEGGMKITAAARDHLGPKEEKNKRSFMHLLMYRRHLEDPTLAFYLDKIAQKHYLIAMGISVPLSHVAKYGDELYSKEEITESNREAQIPNLLPPKSDYVIKPSHGTGHSVVVSYDEDTNTHQMQEHGHAELTKVDDHDVAHRVSNALKRPVQTHYLDPWPLVYVQPGVVIEDRLTAFDSTDKPPMQLSVYVIWGRVWMATWNNAEGIGHSAVVFRNGTCIMDDMATIHVPRWAKWNFVVETAEDIAAHKDMLQVDFLVGVSSEVSQMLTHASRQEKLAEIQVVVSGMKLVPSSKFPHEGLSDEMGRLWLSGYEMGISKLIPNDEVPAEYVKHHRLTEGAAKQLEQTYEYGLLWKLGSTLDED